jgi:hypothetical protein
VSSAQVLAARTENVVQIGAGSSLSVGLDDDDPAASWTLDVYADLPQTSGSRWVGRVTTPPPAGDPRSRVVAIASVPGAVGWRVVLRAAGGPSVATARCELAVAEYCGAPGLALAGGPAVALGAPAYSASTLGFGSVLGMPGRRLARAGAWSAEALAWLQLFDQPGPPNPASVPLMMRPIARGAYAEFVFPLTRVFSATIWAALSLEPDTFSPASGWIAAESSP